MNDGLPDLWRPGVVRRLGVKHPAVPCNTQAACQKQACKLCPQKNAVYKCILSFVSGCRSFAGLEITSNGRLLVLTEEDISSLAMELKVRDVRLHPLLYLLKHL